MKHRMIQSIAKSRLARNKPIVISGKTAHGLDTELLNEIEKYITGELRAKPTIDFLYRGVPITISGRRSISGRTDVPITNEQIEYVHVTPWAKVASRGGKGGFGDPRAHKVYVHKAPKDVELYRGGALAGDPLESTRIQNIGGGTWDSLLDAAKQLYETELLRARSRLKRESYGVPSEFAQLQASNLAKAVASRTVDDFIKATFETDLFGRPGIWKGRTAPRSLMKERPRLRSNQELQETLLNRINEGYTKDEILNMPESLILRKSEQGRKLLSEIEDLLK